MTDLATLIQEDLSVQRRCYLFGTTPLGGSDACRPELQDDGSIVMKSLDVTSRAYKITEEMYRELRQYPKLLVGMWSFVDETDEDAEYVASAHRSPSSAGHRIGRLQRETDKQRALIETLSGAARQFMEIFVADDGEQFLTVEGIEPNEMAQRYDALAVALAAAKEQSA